MSFFREDTLTDFERKLITIMQHNNKRGRVVTLTELEMRIGHNSTEIKEVINDLIGRNWIEENNGNWIVIRKLF